MFVLLFAEGDSGAETQHVVLARPAERADAPPFPVAHGRSRRKEEDGIAAARGRVAAMARSGVMSSRIQKARPWVPTDQIVVLDDQIVDRHHRQVALETLPRCAVIGRKEEPGLGADKEQPGLDRDPRAPRGDLILGKGSLRIGPTVAIVVGLVESGR